MLNVVRGEYLTAVVALGGCAFCYGLIFPVPKVIRGKVTPRADVDDAGTTFRPDRGIDIPVQVSLLGAVVASALIAVLVPLGKLDIPVPPSMRLSLPFMSSLIVAMGTPMLLRNVSRGGTTKYLRLTPAGFELSQGLRSHSGDWQQVQDITDEAPGKQAPTPSAIVFVMSDDSAPKIAAGAMTPGGTALRELVRFYWQHPESRGELTDGGAVKRLAALDARS
ncbi:hypothetical protein [Mycolicibacterium moriokaense]|uniref:PH (Pleckstrin Homology) domain-containing protein n=1 Tax=Mycolicibacterium moriokaense TaxID=39691 RepID=A0A318H276_9MYCO|nr:hypothetical protein [Mycolicibacterium moriokaense]PXW96709.1 hypothetical protein C8E89_15116 [Mycolicibacterium moriokaense]